MKTNNRSRTGECLRIFCILTFVLLCFAAIPKAQASQNNLVFILDASGSMWGQVEGTAKIVIAKEVLTDLIHELPSDTQVGLVAYGHRRKGDCQDVEQLVPLGAFDKELLITKIKALNPKGKTPITHSIQITAEKLKALEDETTIILVSDGKETCEGDPCTLVKELRQSGVKFVMHVIGFDVTDEERSQLECIAEAGGGMYYTAKNAGEFRLAAKKVVKETQTLGFLEVSALRNGKPIAADIIIRAQDSGERITQGTTSTNMNQPATLRLKPGVYTVQVTDSGVPDRPTVTFTDLEIETGQTVVKSAEFSASALEVVALKNGEPVNARVTVFRQGETDRLAYGDTNADQPAAFILLPGFYDIQVVDLSLPDKPEVNFKGVEIKAGEKIEKIAEFTQEGTLSVTALKGGAPFRTHVWIYPQGEQSYLASKDTGKDQAAIFGLLPGVYDVKVEDFSLPDKPEVNFKGVEIKAGEKIEKIAEFTQEGTLSVTALKGGAPFRTHVWIYPQGEQSYLASKDTGKDQAAIFGLLPGVYDVKVEDFSLPDKPEVNFKGVEIKAGEKIEKIAEFTQEGTLSVTALKGGAPFRTHVWIYPQGEQSYLASKDTGKDQAAIFGLLPGVYDVKVEDFSLPDKPEVNFKGVEIKAGEKIEKIAEFTKEGTLSVTALKGGAPFRTHVWIYPQGEQSYLASKDTGKDQAAIFGLLPGVYDVKVEDFSLPDKPEVNFKGVEIKAGEKIEKIAEFTKEGTLSVTALKGGAPFRTHVWIYPQGEQSYLASKDTGKDQAAIFGLLPGVYDVKVEDFSLPDKPEVNFKGVEIKAGEKIEKIAEFTQEGTLSVTALKGGAPFRTHVWIYPQGEQSYLASKDTGKDQAAIFGLLPGVYDVKVEDFTDKTTKEFKGVIIESGKTENIEAAF